MKTVGILGGMGPQATVDFLNKLLRLTGDDCPRIIMDLDPTIPSRTLAAMGKGPDPGPRIMQAIHALEAQGAAIVAVPCNSAHAWHPGRGRWLSMTAAVSNAIRGMGVDNPLIVGGYATVELRLYTRHILGARYMSDADNASAYDLIAEIKRARVPGRDLSAKMAQIIGSYRDCGAVILACTEFSLVWPVDGAGGALPLAGMRVIDSSWEYAKAVVAKAEGD